MLHWNNWKTRTPHDLPGNQCNLDQCQFQATLPDEHGQDRYIKKPARLQCTDEGMAMELARLCPGDHYHLPIEGSSPESWSWQSSRSFRCLPQGIFCSMISQLIINIFVTQEPSRATYMTITDEICAGEEDNEAPMDFENVSDVWPDSPEEPPEPHQEV